MHSASPPTSRAARAAQHNLAGIVAILRGVRPDEVLAIGHALRAGGVRIIEVPLNSPEPFESIRRLAGTFGDDLLIGAGTVLTPAEAEQVAAAGGRLIVAPNIEPAVVERARALGMLTMPGVATPTEAFRALAAGADALKLFPAELLSPVVMKSWRAAFPKSTQMFAVGGITAANLGAYKVAGAVGVGVGSTLYKPGRTAAEIEPLARTLVTAWESA